MNEVKNVEEYFPIVRWRTNYEEQLKKYIQHLDQCLKKAGHAGVFQANAQNCIKCPFCVKYFRMIGQKSKDGSNCASHISRSAKTGRYFISCGFGSFLDGDVLGYCDRRDEPFKPLRHNNICDYCILQKLKQGQLHVVRVAGGGDVSDALGTPLQPSQEQIEQCMKELQEPDANVLLILSQVSRKIDDV